MSECLNCGYTNQIDNLEKEIQLLRALVVEARPYVKKYRQTNSDLVVSETNRIFNWLKRAENIKVD